MPNNLDAFIPEVWSAKQIIKLRQVNVAMAVCANMDYQGEIRQSGDTVQVRTVGRVTTQKYARGQSINYESLAPTREPMTISDSDMFAFEVDDLDNVQSDIDIYSAYTEEGVVAFDELIDTKIFSYTSSAHTSNRISNGGSAIDVTSTGSGTAVYELLVQAKKNLNNFSVPQKNRWAILTPYVLSLLDVDTKYLIRATAMGDTVVAGGLAASDATNYVGRMAGFDLFWSNGLLKSGSNYYLPYGQGRPISYASQIQTVERIRLERTFATAVRGLLLHDGKVFDEHSKRLGSILVDNS